MAASAFCSLHPCCSEEAGGSFSIQWCEQRVLVMVAHQPQQILEVETPVPPLTPLAQPESRCSI